jgi:Raf kinase inhibitor-like YbhB/YbcL family protein
MSRIFAPVLLAAALASCGAADQAPAANQEAATAARPAQARLNLASDAFANGQAIPAVYSCDGANRSPALRWSSPPPATRSFALVVDDPDAPRGTFRHWGAYDIPASARGIASGQHVGTEVLNDAGKPGYTGPCPPKGKGVHHYHVRLFALDVARLDVGGKAGVAEVENAAGRHAIAQGELIGTFERK